MAGACGSLPSGATWQWRPSAHSAKRTGRVPQQSAPPPSQLCPHLRPLRLLLPLQLARILARRVLQHFLGRACARQGCGARSARCSSVCAKPANTRHGTPFCHSMESARSLAPTCLQPVPNLPSACASAGPPAPPAANRHMGSHLASALASVRPPAPPPGISWARPCGQRAAAWGAAPCAGCSTRWLSCQEPGRCKGRACLSAGRVC